MLKKIKEKFESFSFFYSYLGWRIFISLCLSLVVGILDGLGLAMFLPLLQMVDGQSAISGENLGNLKFLIDGIKVIGLPLTLFTILCIMLVFFLLKAVVKFFEGYYRLVLQQKFVRKIRFDNLSLLSGFSYSAFVRSDAGRIQNTLSGEVEKVINAYRNYFTAFQFAVMVFVYVGMAFTVNPQFSFLVIGGAFLANMIFNRFYKRTKDNSKKLTGELHLFQGLLIQLVHNFKYLKATGLVDIFGQKLKKVIVNTQESQRKIGIFAIWITVLREPIVVSIIVVVILLEVYIFNQSLGLLILSLLFFYRSLSFLMSLQNAWNSFYAASGSLTNMREFMSELKSEQLVFGTDKFQRLDKCLTFKNLYFSYGQKIILKRINLKIAKNETVAIVGESGSGKTTLVNIISGLLQVEKGSFFIDGNDICDIDIRSYQRKLGYITQEPVIFNDTIFNNITFWAERSDINLRQFNKAVELASISNFIQELPFKENTSLGDNGILISGGQKQRISIARELYKEAQLLIMDEATSALDSETEKEIQQNIDALRGKYTIIIIAHRLSTIKNADRIVYLNKGEIDGIGTFEELRESSPKFFQLTQLQEF